MHEGGNTSYKKRSIVLAWLTVRWYEIKPAIYGNALVRLLAGIFNSEGVTLVTEPTTASFRCFSPYAHHHFLAIKNNGLGGYVMLIASPPFLSLAWYPINETLKCFPSQERNLVITIFVGWCSRCCAFQDNVTPGNVFPFSSRTTPLTMVWQILAGLTGLEKQWEANVHVISIHSGGIYEWRSMDETEPDSNVIAPIP